jgi:cytochrome P450
MSGNGISLDNINIIGPEHYRINGYPHPEWAYLREHKPVFWCDDPEVEPFWAITKYADIVQISKQPGLFASSKNLAVLVVEPGGAADPPAACHLLNMNPPEHGEYRAVVNRRFTPRTVRDLHGQIERITCEVLDGIMGREELDFVTEVSSKIPLAVIAELLGAPHQDWEQLFRWTNETIGSGDPEFQQGATQKETFERALMGLFSYFSTMTDERTQHPTGDITSIVASSQVHGCPMGRPEMLSYIFLLVVAGNETTRNATTGGLLAFMEHPDQWVKLKSNPSLLKPALEEILRWTSPVIHFLRTATADTEIRGQKIRAGERVCMFYPSGNRDDEVFEQPFKFEISRNPNPHIAFGIGEHFCLGANLARFELEVIFRQLLARLERVEPAGEVERLRSHFVGGIKHMPVRMKLRPAA